MTIQETVKEMRAIRIEMDNTRPTAQIRLTRLSDRLWDLQARYDMLLRVAGLERP